MHEVLIIGGGLAGLTSAIMLADAGHEVVLYEKKRYPYHKVCGEYVSNEVLPFLRRLGIHPEELGSASISRLELSSQKGRRVQAKLHMGGFGLSRYSLDHHLVQIARAKGAKIIEGVSVSDISYDENGFTYRCSDGSEGTARVAIGAYGKRAALDRQLERPFFSRRSPWVGVKYHVKTSFPEDTIALFNFESGYCGLNKIEDDKYCLCYLASREDLKKHGSIEELERGLLYKNRYLKEVFETSEMLYEKPEVINEISFDTKSPVEGHILMAGDAAGMIAPLCGNGMAMAIHAGKLAAEQILSFFLDSDREKLEREYAGRWYNSFAGRMKAGRAIQELYKHQALAETALALLNVIPPVKNMVISMTHGKELI